MAENHKKVFDLIGSNYQPIKKAMTDLIINLLKEEYNNKVHCSDKVELDFPHISVSLIDSTSKITLSPLTLSVENDKLHLIANKVVYDDDAGDTWYFDLGHRCTSKDYPFQVFEYVSNVGDVPITYKLPEFNFEDISFEDLSKLAEYLLTK